MVVEMMKLRIFGGGVLVLALALIVLSFYHYAEAKKCILEQVDSQLYSGTTALRYTVGDEFHDRFLRDDDAEMAERSHQVSRVLTRLCRDLKLKSLYTMVMYRDDIYLTSSSLSDQELISGEFNNYFKRYRNPDPAELAAFRSHGSIYMPSPPQWDSYRTLLVPCQTAQGFSYLAAANIDATEVERALAEALNRALLECLVMLLVCVPVALVFVWPLRRQLFTDDLTGLGNRLCLKRDLLRCRFPQLTLVNIDGFKDINNFYGGPIGDKLLIRVGDYLRKLVPSQTRIYRISGDEYALLCDSSPRCVSVEYLMERINEQRFVIGDSEFRLSLTAGVAQGPHKLLEHADLALKEAKRIFRSYVHYSPDLHSSQSSHANLLWTSKIKEGVENNRFCAYFQPIYDNRLKKISHYESLIRLVELDGTIVGPDFFMEAARKSRVSSFLTTFMIDQALHCIEQHDVSCTVNLSIDDIVDNESRQTIIEHIRKKTAREKLVFEIIESEGIENYQVIKSFIDQVRIYGIKVAVDDFGTGYSNFDHVSQLEVDYIKIDGGLIAQLNDSERAKTIIEAIVHFARELGIYTIAEYVSTPELQETVVALGIDYSQGYLWGRPQSQIRSEPPVSSAGEGLEG
jgi:diguanylate cyclase (GGDEF)-like protein